MNATEIIADNMNKAERKLAHAYEKLDSAIAYYTGAMESAAKSIRTQLDGREVRGNDAVWQASYVVDSNADRIARYGQDVLQARVEVQSVARELEMWKNAFAEASAK